MPVMESVSKRIIRLVELIEPNLPGLQAGQYTPQQLPGW